MSVIRRHSESPEIPNFEPRLFVKVLKSVGSLRMRSAGPRSTCAGRHRSRGSGQHVMRR